MNIIDMLKPSKMVWVQYKFDGQVEYVIITKNRLRETYHLCEVKGNKLVEIAKSNNPLDLDEKVYKHKKKKGSGDN